MLRESTSKSKFCEDSANVTVHRGDEQGPATRKGRETRQRIVDAAADLIYERGVAAASLDDVGRATGTSKSQLYHYFSGKNALVGAVIDRQRDRILAFQRPVLEALATWEDITSWRDMIVVLQRELGCRGGCPLGSLANELAELDDTARVQLADAIGSWEQLLADGLATMAQRGELRSDADPATLALSVMASLQGGLLLAKTTRSTYPLEVALDAAIAYLRTFASPKPNTPSRV